MLRPARALIGLPFVTLLLAGCTRVAPTYTTGFSIEAIERLSLGMSREETRALLGRPLPPLSPTVDSGSHTPSWSYAEPGATWLLGEYRFRQRGHEMRVWFADDRVTGMRFYDAETVRRCECSVSDCPTGWRQCVGQLAH